MALMGNAKFRAYFLGRGYQGEKIVAVLDNEPAVDVLERIVSHQAPVVLAVKTPTAPWGFALRRVESWPTGGEQEVEVVEFAEETSIGMLVAPTGPHQFEVPRESEEPVRLLVA
jgi:hypothetical protein